MKPQRKNQKNQLNLVFNFYLDEIKEKVPQSFIIERLDLKKCKKLRKIKIEKNSPQI